IMKKLMDDMLSLEVTLKEEKSQAEKKLILLAMYKIECKFDRKADEGFFFGYSLNSKAFSVFNNRTRIVEENLHIRFNKNTPNIARSGPNWLFDIDALTKSMNYKPVVAGNQSNGNADLRQESKYKDQEKEDNVNSINNVNTAGTNRVNVVGENTNNELPFDPEMPALEDISTFNFSSDQKDADEEADMNNMETTIQEELLQFKLQEVWTLVDLPYEKRAIGTKWVFLNKKDERVARIEATRLFLAYASLKDFVVYQMDVKNAFLYEKIEEEVYVCKPPGFEDPDFPDTVYKVEKSRHRLHQAPRAWYETLSTYLVDNGFHIGKIYKTLFIKRHKDDILLVQVYVEDIIFGSTKKELCNAFEKMMHEKFQMSSMEELTFFLGLQNASTPMETQKLMVKDKDGEEVDVHMYRSMIGSLMYLTSSRPDIMFVVCACARYQVNPKFSHLQAMKTIFSARNKPLLQIPQQKLNMWMLQVDVDKYSGFKINCLIMGITYYCWVDVNALKVYTSCIEQFWATVKAKTINEEGQLQALVDGKKVIITESIIRRDLQLEDGEDEAVNKEMNDSLERAATSATSLDAEQDRGKTSKTQSKATPNESGSQGTDSGGGPRCQEAMRDTVTQTRSERVSKVSYDPLLVGVNTPRSGKDSLKINKLMELCTNLQNKVGLSAIVESFKDKGLGEEDASKQGRIADIDSNEDIYLVNIHKDKDIFVVNDLDGNEVIIEDTEMLFDVADDLREKRRKFFGGKRFEGKRNRPPTIAQQKTIMCTYLKNMDGWKLKSLKKKSFAEIQELFDKAMKRVNTFVDYRTELLEESLKNAEAEITQEGSSKRARDELEQERSKKQKVEDDKESKEMFGNHSR
nr:hypothetical protein [Tanacetum cinerariifolium]